MNNKVSKRDFILKNSKRMYGTRTTTTIRELKDDGQKLKDERQNKEEQERK